LGRTPGTLLAALALICAVGFGSLLGDPARESSPEIFTDITEEAGISWRHFNGESEDRFLIEAMSGGVAFFDFDGDGLLDIFFVNGGETPRGKSSAPVRNALYHNLGNGKFEEVAERAGVSRVPFYGMGVAAADFDNDGFPDLFVTGYPSSALFHNNGDGTFTDVTEKAGLKNSGKWAASAAWFDYDRDGFLDLVVCNYARFTFDDPKKCEYNGVRTYCEQKAYDGMPLSLYHNNGDGTFTDVSSQSGLAQFVGRALGVVSIDFNDDGWPDLFVARDAHSNLLLVNQRNGKFADLGLDAEVAYDPNGLAKAGMGVDTGDVNDDGWPDFVVTNFNDEYHSLFLNPGSFPFEDSTVRSHLAGYTRPFVGWGTQFLDYDNDGYLDLIIVNGHINPVIEFTRADIKYKEPPLLLRNNGKGVLQNMKDAAGPTFRTALDGRGLAVGDFDNDGDPDVAIVRLKDRPILLRNNVGQDRPWVGLQLKGTKSNRDGIGAKLTLQAGNRRTVRWVTGGGSYLSSQDRRVLFGLGPGPPPKEVNLEIRWPSGQIQKVHGLQTGRYHVIQEPLTSR
jgi:enediyne biosynthesis protein E4